MRFLVDAQLPRRMAGWLVTASCDAVHILDLPDGSRTSDKQVIAFADQEQRVVVTKDADFVNEQVLHGRPAKLLLVSTGNIGNQQLNALFVPLVPDLVQELQAHSFLELGRTGIIIRG